MMIMIIPIIHIGWQKRQYQHPNPIQYNTKKPTSHFITTQIRPKIPKMAHQALCSKTFFLSFRNLAPNCGLFPGTFLAPSSLISPLLLFFSALFLGLRVLFSSGRVREVKWGKWVNWRVAFLGGESVGLRTRCFCEYRVLREWVRVGEGVRN